MKGRLKAVPGGAIALARMPTGFREGEGAIGTGGGEEAATCMMDGNGEAGMSGEEIFTEFETPAASYVPVFQVGSLLPLVFGKKDHESCCDCGSWPRCSGMVETVLYVCSSVFICDLGEGDLEDRRSGSIATTKCSRWWIDVSLVGRGAREGPGGHPHHDLLATVAKPGSYTLR